MTADQAHREALAIYGQPEPGCRLFDVPIEELSRETLEIVLQGTLKEAALSDRARGQAQLQALRMAVGR